MGPQIFQQLNAPEKVIRHVHLDVYLHRDEDLRFAKALVEYWPSEHDSRLAVWEDKWLDKMVQYEMTGGCGCCNEIYTVLGPRIAIHEFPVSEGRRQYYPKWEDDADRYPETRRRDAKNE